MNFLHPLLLAGIALVGLPVLIHLVHRRRAIRRPLPTIEFLLRSNKRLARRLKVKQLLLLLLRMGLFVVLPLALAQPYLAGRAIPESDSRLPTAVVFILDDSASMAHTDGSTSAFDRARSRLVAELDRLRSWDQVALVLAHSPPVSPVDPLVQDHGRIREVVQGLVEPSHLPTDLPAALALARDLHALSELPARRTVLITDNAGHGWSSSAVSPEELTGLGPIEIIDVRDPDRPADRSNVAIVEGGYRESAAGVEGDYEVWARLHNYGILNQTSLSLDLWIDDTPRGRALLDLPPDGDTISQFQVTIGPSGVHRAHFQLSGQGPEEEEDNRFYLTLQLDREVQALLVNGDPRQIPYRDELFYLERALSTGAEDRSGVSSTVVGFEGLNLPFDDFDVVVLANVPSLPRGQIAQLVQFVRDGGGLLLTLGDRVQPELYNSLFSDLLPKPLRSVRELCHRLEPDANLLATRVARVDRSHPVFRIFDLPGGESIQSVSVFSYMLLEPSVLNESRTLASYGDGGPALVEQEFQAGRVALLTTSVDRDWTDWPIRTAYLPMMRRLIRHLARRGAVESETQAVVGQRRTINLEAQNPDRVTVIEPQGGRHVLMPENQEVHALVFTPPKPGHYQVSLSISGAERQFDELLFSANLDPDESDLTTADGQLVDSYLTAAAAGQPPTAEWVDLPHRRISLWPLVLLAFVLLLCIELAVAVRRHLYARIREWLGAWQWVSHPGHRLRLRFKRPGKTDL